jgi:hypothetical protein
MIKHLESNDPGFLGEIYRVHEKCSQKNSAKIAGLTIRLKGYLIRVERGRDENHDENVAFDVSSDHRSQRLHL